MYSETHESHEGDISGGPGDQVLEEQDSRCPGDLLDKLQIGSKGQREHACAFGEQRGAFSFKLDRVLDLSINIGTITLFVDYSNKLVLVNSFPRFLDDCGDPKPHPVTNILFPRGRL